MTHSDLGILRDTADDGNPGRHRHRHRPKESSPARGLAALLVVLALLGTLAGGAWYGGSRLLAGLTGTPDFAGAGVGSVLVVVKPGDTASDVARTLLRRGVVKSTKAFISAARGDARSLALQPGTYRLHKQMKASLALALLLDPAARVRSRVTLPEGLTVKASLARIAQATGIDPAQLKAAAEKPASLGLPSYAGGRLEGFLYPATYDIEPGTSATAVLQAMVTKFKAVAASTGLEARAGAQHLTAYQVVILASMVEREGRIPAENPKIARVILNRLHAGVPLGVDASVLYGLGRTSGALSVVDLARMTPYNTRKRVGLPPTPIASPGQAAIEAVLAPAAGNWLYYVLMDKAGHQFFTNDYNAFVRQKAKSQHEGLI
ncbi:MAG: endolytic transglycosylase MltG [Actinomycetota bacterium]|nr:endolytic transglycosylase MltG [Actinomycetota bacterium]